MPFPALPPMAKGALSAMPVPPVRVILKTPGSGPNSAALASVAAMFTSGERIVHAALARSVVAKTSAPPVRTIVPV